MRPSYSKFLHFIASSPQQETQCEAGLQRFEVELTLPSGSTVNQTTRIHGLVTDFHVNILTFSDRFFFVFCIRQINLKVSPKSLSTGSFL